MKIKNFSLSDVKFHWSIYEANFDSKFNVAQDAEFFSITPLEGHFAPGQELSFEVKFNPKNALIYEQKIEMIVEDVPFQSIKDLTNLNLLEMEHSTNHLKSEPFMLALNSPYPSYPLFTFNLIGSGKLCQVEVKPAIIDFGDVYLYQKKKQGFSVSNKDTNILTFRLREIMQVLHVKGENTINNYFKEYLETKLCNRQIINSKKYPDGDFNNEMKLELGLLEGQEPTHLNHNLLDIKLIDSLFDRFDQDSNNHKVNFVKLTTKNLNKSFKPVENKTKKQKKSLLHNIKRDQSNIDNSKGSISNSKIEDVKNSISLTANSYIEDEIEENNTFSLKINETMEFNISFTPNLIGAYKSSIVFNVVDGVPFSIEVKANVIGPSILVNIPFLNFGLTAISDIKKLNLKIKNTSQIPCRFLLKESRFKNINLGNYLESGYVEEIEGVIMERVLKPMINNFLDFEEMNERDITRKYKYELKFSKVTEVLQPEQEIDIIVSFASPFPVLYREIIEIMVENSESTYINIYGDVQEAIAYLSAIEVIPSNIYVSVPIVYNNNIITLVNPSNIPISFNWKNIFINDDITAEFSPSIGTVPPKSSLDISYKVLFFKIREVDELFTCRIKEMDMPLGFVLKGRVTGLDIIYELTDEAYNYMN